MENTIKLGENKNRLRLWIETVEGNKTGEYLDFYVSSIELLGKWEELTEMDRKNKSWLNSEEIIINKKQDFKPKNKIMTNNQKLIYEARKKFVLKQKEVYDMFLGNGGVDKLLYGRPLCWETYLEIDKLIKDQIFPYLKTQLKSIDEEIKDKYKPEENEVLE